MDECMRIAKIINSIKSFEMRERHERGREANRLSETKKKGARGGVIERERGVRMRWRWEGERECAWVVLFFLSFSLFSSHPFRRSVSSQHLTRSSPTIRTFWWIQIARVLTVIIWEETCRSSSASPRLPSQSAPSPSKIAALLLPLLLGIFLINCRWWRWRAADPNSPSRNRSAPVQPATLGGVLSKALLVQLFSQFWLLALPVWALSLIQP